MLIITSLKQISLDSKRVTLKKWLTYEELIRLLAR